MSGVGRIAGKGAGDGERVPRWSLTGASNGDPANDSFEKEDRREEGFLACGGSIADIGVAGRGRGVDGVWDGPTTGSWISEASVIADPASDAFEERLAMLGVPILNEAAREVLISIELWEFERPCRDAGWTVSVLPRWVMAWT